MSNTSKESLRAEIAKLCADQGKALPEGLDELKLEALTGVKDPRRPGGPAAGAVRANSEPPAAPAASTEPAAPAAPTEPPPGPSSGDDEPSPSDPPKSEPAVEKPEAEKPKRFRVAEGRMVVCVPGKIGAFQEIRALDLAGGQEELDALLEDGTVEPVKR